ncbi:hypothetical protein GYMLUDRAFT_385784 [Collybiopsis luxurians FD-317 M1]|nr:hypothetical protein GYMLUDRAFT_385784 [Collybiopsis luxurians FD-317 M1]
MPAKAKATKSKVTRAKAPEVSEGPIHRLATETLSHIFSFCPPSPEALFKSSWSAHKTEFVALKISHVSRHWRAVSHSTPLLWRTISIRDPWLGKYMVDGKLLARYIKRVKHYLKLSGNVSLQIVLTEFPYFEYFDKHSMRALGGLIGPISSSANRWQSFHARLYDYYFFHHIFDLYERMPSLTELCLKAEFTNDEYKEDDGDGVALEARKFPKSTPNLEILSLSGIHLMGVKDISRLSSAKPLRDITIRSIKFEEVASIMNAASANTTLELRDVSFDEEKEDAYRCSSHTLKVIAPRSDPEELEEGNPVAIFFKKLTLEPSVKALELTIKSDEAIPFPLTSFKSVLSRSSSTAITDLSLRYMHISDTHFLNLLAILPSLTHLTFEEYTSKAKFPISEDFLPPPPHSNGFFDSLAISDHKADDKTFVSEDSSQEDSKLDEFGDGKPFDHSLCPLLPKLTDLTLIFRNSLITEHAIAMIKSRILSSNRSDNDSNVAGMVSLQRVCLQYAEHRLLDEKSQAELMKLGESEGLMLKFELLSEKIDESDEESDEGLGEESDEGLGEESDEGLDEESDEELDDE